ncbi:MAG: Asp-tRNA(Asn)/Glu-tRNA(Gln) amidotransferase subunit GatB [Patescibacteria group bacterium]
MDSTLLTIIGLEIHVQLKTKSKMFCRCDNNAEGKAPNTVVCPVCLGLPGALPVANKQAIEWTIKTGIALNAQISPMAKFDRKHYFYPDLPKGYQISQYDEPFCVGGYIEIEADSSRPTASNNISNTLDASIVRAKRELSKIKIRFNRIHLEEDAGKLIHSNGQSLVDLNRAGTPLMEIVTEPDITSPKMAGDFLRRLQKVVRDEVEVSDADMEKGHLRCDANISICESKGERRKGESIRMSEIVEIKNLNSFKFVEKALALEEVRLKADYPNWPKKRTKVTRGYDSVKNITYVQRQKEESADYRYFPEPDIPPIDTSKIDQGKLAQETTVSLEEKIDNLISMGLTPADAEIIVKDKTRWRQFNDILTQSHRDDASFVKALAQSLIHNYFGFSLEILGGVKTNPYIDLIEAFADGQVTKAQFSALAKFIHDHNSSYEEAKKAVGLEVTGDRKELEKTVETVLSQNSAEVVRYKSGRTQLFGFFVGQVMRETGGRADPKLVNEILRRKLIS